MLLVSWTYWNSEFTVVGLTLLWVYLRRNEAFIRFRNWILLANMIGLVGYVVVPTAPPRMFPTFGFPDTLANIGALNHGSGLVQLAANPYAAMPSLHAADALIVGITMALVCRHWWAKALWLLWPAWVWFAVMATGNHFWLDILAGHRRRARRGRRRLPAADPAAPAPEPGRGLKPPRVDVKSTYTDGARRIASRSMTGLARTRVTPSMLTAAGVSLCILASVLVYFEYRNEWLFFWAGSIVFVLGSILDILDGALARAGGKATAFGAFLDSTTDRIGEAFMLGAIGVAFARDGNETALDVHVRGDGRLVPRLVHAVEGGDARPEGRRRHRLAGRARGRHLPRPGASPRGAGCSGRSTCSRRPPGSRSASGSGSVRQQLRERD